MSQPVLSIRGLSLWIAGKQLFRDLSFDLPPSGLTGFLGPMGAGKSTLLTWLCGTAPKDIVESQYDRAELAGQPIELGNRPPLLGQNVVRNETDAMTRLSDLKASGSPLICLDEPTVPLEPDSAARVLGEILNLAQDRTILMVSHNQLQVASYADNVMLVAAGELQEFSDAKRFFTAPSSKAGKQFVGTGGTSVIGPAVDRRHLQSELREVPAELELITENNDTMLRWIVRDRLAVFRRNGSDHVSGSELEALSDRGISSLVAIDQQCPLDLSVLAEAGLVGVWFPIDPDMQPSVLDCQTLCEECDRLIDDGQKVAVVMNPASGVAERTVGAQLVHMGLPAGLAADVIRSAFAESQLTVSDEQLLWDLELANDLESTTTNGDGRGRVSRQRVPGTAKGSVVTFVGPQEGLEHTL